MSGLVLLNSPSWHSENQVSYSTQTGKKKTKKVKKQRKKGYIELLEISLHDPSLSWMLLKCENH